MKKMNNGSLASRNVLMLLAAIAIAAATFAGAAAKPQPDGGNGRRDEYRRGFEGRDDHDWDDMDRDHHRESYAIGLWGDLPYSDLQATTGVPNLIMDMNGQHLAFTVHDGDLKAGNATTGSSTPTSCSDAMYDQASGDYGA